MTFGMTRNIFYFVIINLFKFGFTNIFYLTYIYFLVVLFEYFLDKNKYFKHIWFSLFISLVIYTYTLIQIVFNTILYIFLRN